MLRIPRAAENAPELRFYRRHTVKIEFSAKRKQAPPFPVAYHL